MIPFKRYIDIVSGVGAGAAVAGRNFGLRVFTTNTLLPPASYIEFSNSTDVTTYFGAGSEESKRALAYFGFVNKRGLAPTKMSFARWVNAAVAPLIFGNTAAKVLATVQAVTAGGFTLTIGGVGVVVAALNLSGAASLAAAAALVQVALRAAGGAAAGCNVTYDAVRGSFNFQSVITGAATITVTDGAQTAAAVLGWTTGTGLILSPGAAIETLTASLDNSATASNDFGSFCFTDTAALSLVQVTEVATWNHAQGVTYMYLQRVTAANAAAWMAAEINFTGGGYTLESPTGLTEYPEQLPGMVWAASDYNRRLAAQNFMYQVAALTASVTTNALADTYDALRLNYYGSTMQAGQVLSFYQRGFLTGLATVPLDMGAYANECWLKSDAGRVLMQLQLGLTQIPANSTGRSFILTALTQDTIQTAILNGTILAGKILTTVQQNFITALTGDLDAWRQVQNVGYWLDVTISPQTNALNGQTEYVAAYTLVYSKADSVRKITGSHVLI